MLNYEWFVYHYNPVTKERYIIAQFACRGDAEDYVKCCREKVVPEYSKYHQYGMLNEKQYKAQFKEEA